jgi:hypothetical protein
MKRSFRLVAAAVLAGTLVAGCSSFDSRVKEAQTQIEDSFEGLGYQTGDVVEFTSQRRELKDHEWFERRVRFRDRGDRDPAAIHQYFAHDAPYEFEYDLLVGESLSTIQKIRWYEFKIDDVFTVYRVEFVSRVRPQLQ